MKYLEILEHEFCFDYNGYEKYLIDNSERIGRSYVDECIKNDFFHDYVFKDLTFHNVDSPKPPYGGNNFATMKLSRAWRNRPDILVKYYGVAEIDFSYDSKYPHWYIYGAVNCKNGYVCHEIMLETGTVFIKARIITAETINDTQVNADEEIK